MTVLFNHIIVYVPKYLENFPFQDMQILYFTEIKIYLPNLE